MVLREPNRQGPIAAAGAAVRVVARSGTAAQVAGVERLLAALGRGPGPPAARGRWAALGWLLRRFPEPEADEGESPAAERAAVAAQAAGLRARTPARAAPVEAVLAALTGRAPG
jgi:hypothetical protein